MEQKFPKRQTAYKFWIKDILNAKPLNKEGIHLFGIRGKEASRLNVMGVVVDKRTNEEKTFSTITIDDGTDLIRAKTWREDIQKLEQVNLGDPVMIIGKLRLYGDELSIIPEIVKKQEPEWLRVRKQELEKEYGKPEEREAVQEQVQQTQDIEKPQQIIEEEVIGQPTEKARQKILNIIEQETAPEGAQMNEVIKKSGLTEQEAESIIDELMKEGEIFQPRTGFLKVI